MLFRSVESWLPQTQVNAIYKAGLDAANCQTPEQQGPIRAALHDACQSLYTKTQIDLPLGLLDQLLPPLAESIGAEPSPVDGAAPAKTNQPVRT